MTMEGDDECWRCHDLDRGHLSDEQKEYFQDQAVWLCVRCGDVGFRNGRKIAHLAEDRKLLIHQVRAEQAKGAKNQSASVMLTRNVAYLYGLANGSRGRVVGVVYGPGGVGSFPGAIVVEFPDYCGPAFYQDEPK